MITLFDGGAAMKSYFVLPYKQQSRHLGYQAKCQVGKIPCEMCQGNKPKLGHLLGLEHKNGIDF